MTPPALALAARETTLLGIPTLVVYVFLVWIVGIALTAVVARRTPRPAAPRPTEPLDRARATAPRDGSRPMDRSGGSRSMEPSGGSRTMGRR